MKWFNRWVVRQLLTAYVDGQLPPAEARAVERFVAQDPVVNEECRALMELNRSLRELAGRPEITDIPWLVPVAASVPEPRKRRNPLWALFDELSRDPMVAVGTVLLGVVAGAVSLLGSPLPFPFNWNL